MTAGQQLLLVTTAGILPGAITGKTGAKHDVGLPSLVVPGLGRNLFYSDELQEESRLSSIVNYYMKINNIVLPLEQQE